MRFPVLIVIEMGRRVTAQSGRFKVRLSYKFKDKAGYTIIEKEFDPEEQRGLMTIFSKKESRRRS